MKVTTDDILDALRTALRAAPKGDGFTRPELARQLGVSPMRAGEAIRALLAEGRLEMVLVNRQGLDGRTMTLKGFRLKKAKRIA